MVSRLRALARWRAHLEEAIGVDEAAEVLDPFAAVEWDQLVTKEHLRSELDRLRAELRAEMHQAFGELRRDLLKVTGAQFFALIAAVAGLVALG
jgi:hypothetical protein